MRLLRFSAGRVSIAFVGPQASRRANAQYRGKDRPTNVLSFTYRPPVDATLGEILLCPMVIRREAGRGEYRQRVKFLIEHGLIHLTGRDHASAGEQRAWDKIERRVSLSV